MKCGNEQQAIRIAMAGAKKMAAQGYNLRPIQNLLPVALQSTFFVKNPDGDRYRVNVKARTCNCPFYLENASFKTCKHIQWAAEELEFEIRAAADAEVYAMAWGENCACS